MRCSGRSNNVDAPGTCGCGGKTVFNGATIGQVFTGDVKVSCPLAGDEGMRALHDRATPRSKGDPLSAALLAVGIYQAIGVLQACGVGQAAESWHPPFFVLAIALVRFMARPWMAKAVRRVVGYWIENRR
jgi:tetrahydromethanopterin S-methyltransferase subunit D